MKRQNTVQKHDIALHQDMIESDAIGKETGTPVVTETSVKKTHTRKAGSPLATLCASLEAAGSSKQDISIITKMMEEMKIRMNDMEGYTEEQAMTIETLQNKCRLNEGRITRQEKMIEDLREKSLQLHARLLHDNIAFYNIPEEPNENVIACPSRIHVHGNENDRRGYSPRYILQGVQTGR